MDVDDTVARVHAFLTQLLPGGTTIDAGSALSEQGLDSLATTRLWFLLRKEFGVDIPVPWLGQRRTVTELVDRIRADAGPDASTSTMDTDPSAASEPFPLTDLQQAYVIGQDPALGEDPIGCHVYREFTVDGIDAPALARGWQRVVDAHPTLRTIVTPDGQQRVLPAPVPVTVPVHDLAAATSVTFDEHVQAVRGRLSHRRREPGAGPPHAVELSLGPAGRGVVHLSIDALLTDGHGLGVILDDWWHCYRDPTHRPAQPELTARDCVRSLVERQRTPEYRAHLDYWARRLGEAPGPPDLGPPAASPVFQGEVWRRTAMHGCLDAEQWRRVREVATAWDVSPTALILTVFVDAFGWQRVPSPFSVVLTTNHRPRLPEELDPVAGPFTSSLVLPVSSTLDRALVDAARETHRQLWQDLEHAEVSGVAAMRAAHPRRGASAGQRHQVVFTSLLGTGRAGGFNDAITYALSQTTGVAVDHQMWERAGELHIRWDVVPELFPTGALEVVFATFVNALWALTPEAPETRPLNELQQAYYVPRATAGPTEWDGCQVYHSFELPDVDPARLESAWTRLVAAYDVLRTVVTHDGQLAVSPHAPARRHIPVIDLSAVADPASYLDEQRDRMVGRALPLGRAPQSDLRVTTVDGTATIHIGTDLTIMDGRSIHLVVRELLRLYADPAAALLETAGYGAYSRTASADAAAHWRDVVGALGSGPRLLDSTAPRVRRRWEGTVPGWRAVRASIEQAGLTADDLLVAAFTEALATHYPTPFSLPVVRWTADSQRYRPGEYTALSWFTRRDPALGLWEQAREVRASIDADVRADGASGLGELRRRVMRERRTGHFDLPVVYTGILDLSIQPLPAGVRLGRWLTSTPDVSLDCITIDDGDELRFSWDAVVDHFPAGQLDAMFARYRQLLMSLLDGPQPTESTMLGEWNDTARPFPADGPAHRLFEEQARQRSRAVALRWGHHTMTYGELDRRANQLAHALRRLRVGPGTGVGISVPRGPELVVSVLGVVKAGGFYVPLEPSLPPARAETILADAAVDIVVTSAGRHGWSLPSGVRAVPVEAPDEPDGAVPALGAVDDMAYVIFTSGSTGKPKGVAVTHRPLLNLLNWCYRTHGFGPDDVGLCVTSLGFDLSVFDIFGLLGCGASLYLANEAEQRDPQLMLDVLLGQPITYWNSAPTSLNQLAPLFAHHLGDAGAASLRLVYLSGDYTPLTLPDEVRALFPNARVVSLGGATEATVWSNWFEVGAVDPAWRSIPYGKPIDNARYYVLDDAVRPCPVGVEGDLYIGGECLSAGYYRQPELTAERFIPDPFTERPDARLYRTGDRASYFPDGNLCFLGRADGQVKVRGFRVELPEIEHQLRAPPDVKDAVVLARADQSGDRKLVAYVQPRSVTPPSVGDLRRHAAQRLPDYMVPNVVTYVDGFPATANGKLDRDALPWPVEAGSHHALAAPTVFPEVPPAVPNVGPAVTTSAGIAALEREIAAILAELLGLSDVDVEADIWDQGATSFTLVQVSGALLRRHGRRVPVSAMLADPTVAGIARAIGGPAESGPAEDGPTGSGLPVESRANPVPAKEPTAREVVSDEILVRPAAGRVAVPDRPGEVDFFSAAERDAFKQVRWDLRRRRPGDPVVRLDDAPVADEHFAWRASHRTFERRPLPSASLSKLLGLVRESQVDGRRRRLYPSAGDTYGVQVYLHVRPDGVEGVPEGLYYYHPVEHALHLIDPAPRIDRSIHFVYNRPIFDEAGFGLFLFGQTDAVAPLYGDESERFLLLEAGYLGQLLLLGQAATAVGLCPIGSVALDDVRAQFGLGEGHRYLHAFLGGPAPVTVPATEQATPLFSAGLRDTAASVAVVGMAARLPGASTVDEFWHNLSRGVRSIIPVPPARAGQVSLDAGIPGGYLSDVDGFDSLLFRVAPTEAAALDPQLRLLLPTVWECLDDAGHTPAGLGRVGVFLGAMWQDYQHVGADSTRTGEPATISGTASEAANRVSHFFGFDGPSVAVDTSCSSSVTALHLAVASLRRGECESAVVAAVNLFTHPHHLRLLSDLGLLARGRSDGAFDAEVTGWTPGEGVAAVLLRRESAARRDGDTITAIVEATGVGHVGSAGRFGTPAAVALRRSLTATLAQAEVTPGDVGHVECAAAGAAIADAAEVEALAQLFAGQPVGIGTVKPNIGHLEAAAGLSQVIKALLELRHRQLAPTVVSSRPNALVPLAGSALRVVDQLAFLTGPRRVLVNAMGATGSYAHVLLRGVDDEAVVPEVTITRHWVPLSAASDGQLRTLADRLHRALASRRDVALADVAYTLQVGRVPLARRAVVSAGTLDELLGALDALRQGRDAAFESTLDEAARRWLAGDEVDWAAQWSDGGARRVPLPGYPFADDHYRLAPAGLPPTALSTPAAVPVRPVPVTVGPSGSMLEYVLAAYAQASGIPVSRLDPHTPLDQYGLSSSLIVGLNARFTAELGEVPSTLFYAHRDLAGVADGLASLSLSPAPQPAVPQPSVVDGRIAVVGMAGRYPGADDLEAFWANLAGGVDAITPLPEGRRRPGWPNELMVGGFLDDVDRFDPLFFGITPREAALMDPQERLFLQIAWHTLEDAGYPRARLRERHGGRVGVFVGSMYNEYPFFGVTQSNGRPADERSTSGSAIAGIANRTSYVLDLHGPSLTIDTMCSSSLTAIHQAVASLRRGECEAALVGGVNLSLHPNKFVALRDLKMAATDHRCRSFGAGGDGFVASEGIGAVLLKPLARAIADGDRVRAIILGSAVNHDGRTNGYTVPSPLAQAALVGDALRDAGVTAADVGYLEAHGTGTALGDPIEVDGLDRAFAAANRAPGSVPIGSVKSGIGHLEAAAGIAGLGKVVLQFEHATLVPSLHADELNPNIDWARSPFRVQRTAQPWPAELPRRAGISSFGAGGANAHIVVEAYDAPARSHDRGPQVVVLSARTVEQLDQMAARLATFLGGTGRSVALADVAYTLRVGREAMRERAVFVVDGVPRLVEALNAYAIGGRRVHGTTGADRVAEAAQRWVDGEGDLEWAAPADGARADIVGLPGYPFARLRCWLPERATDPAPGTVERPPVERVRLLARDWRPVEATLEAPPGDGVVVILSRADQRALAAAVADRLRPSRALIRCEGVDFATASAEPPGLGDEPVAGLVDLCALDGPADSDWPARLAILQQVVTSRPAGGVRVLQVTSGLLDLPGPPPDLSGARLAGFVRMLGSEYPLVRSTVLDLDQPQWTDEPHTADQVAARIATEWRSASPYGEIGVRGGVRYRPDLTPVADDRGTGWRPDPTAAYLVTGGTGALGALTARHLVSRGVRQLAILGHRPLPPRPEWDALTGDRARVVAQIRELERLGARVAIYTGPLTDRARLSRFLADVREGLGPIAGIVHCAGTSDRGPAPFIHKSGAELAGVLEPKTDGLDALVELTRSDRLAFFVLFSSVSAAVAPLGAGISGYAAANAYLDYLAGRENRLGHPWFRSVNWPVWRETGSGVDRPDAAAAGGLDPLTDAAGLDVLDRVLAGTGAPVVLPCSAGPGGFDPEAAVRMNRAPARPAGFDADAAARMKPAVATVECPQWLVELFAETLGIPGTELDRSALFGDLGVESVLLGELLTRIEAALGRPVEPTLLLEYPTLDQLATQLPGASTEPDPTTGPVADQRVAVIGMACRFPGAPDLASFWELLRSSGCAVTEVPPGRWDVASLYDPVRAAGRSISKWGGFVDDIEGFDPEYFGMSDAAARNLDPAIRMTLEATAACLRDAGYEDRELRGGDVGVFMGARMSDYRRRVDLAAAAEGLGGDQNFIAARIAHEYDLRGPCLVVDSACSSALVAVQLAIRSLLAGESRLALAGAAEVLLDERPSLEFSVARALSPRGRCATFDTSADGFVPGECCGVLLLKPLAAALADGDRIHAVIDAVAVGNDGHTMGLTTPNPVAQAQVVRRALDLAGVRADEVGLIEAHGTATMIGDPIELRALTDVFAEHTGRTGFCAIGSVKSNVGHLLSAAGMAGLIKVLLALEHDEIPATLHCDEPNPRFDFAASPFFPVREPRPWPAGPRVAGVSAFGLGGTNAHVVASAAPERAPRRTPLPGPVFRRRRLWWDAVRDVPPARLVASILDLSFVATQPPAEVTA